MGGKGKFNAEATCRCSKLSLHPVLSIIPPFCDDLSEKGDTLRSLRSVGMTLGYTRILDRVVSRNGQRSVASSLFYRSTDLRCYLSVARNGLDTSSNVPLQQDNLAASLVYPSENFNGADYLSSCVFQRNGTILQSALLTAPFTQGSLFIGYTKRVRYEQDEKKRVPPTGAYACT